ncbi:MAG: hypothetical protein ACHQRJ_08100 [Alphaproteobacteria bacterium]
MQRKDISKNAITIEQIKLACRHVNQLMAEGVTENLAIRTLEIFTDVYAKRYKGGSATPHHVDQVTLWSVDARKKRKQFPNAKLRVEHGTPRRAFARKVMELYRERKLNAYAMNQLVKRYWKLAVVTIEEDKRLNKVARSTAFDTPDKRWAAADIKFP